MNRALPVGLVSLAGLVLFCWPFIGTGLPANTPAWTLTIGCVAALLLVWFAIRGEVVFWWIAGPIAIYQLTTADRQSGTVDACFVATAAYGSVMANDVELLLTFQRAFELG